MLNICRLFDNSRNWVVLPILLSSLLLILFVGYGENFIWGIKFDYVSRMGQNTLRSYSDVSRYNQNKLRPKTCFSF